ncbi:MAG: carboxylesterase family protein [Nitrospira sp.]
MRFLSRIRLRLHSPALFLLVLSSLLCVPTSILHGADDASESDLDAQVWQYITSEDGDQARALLGAILQRPDATVQRTEALLRKGPPHSLQPVGLLPDEQVVVRDRTYRYSLSVPDHYEPIRDYALVVCLHGAGFTGEAYLDRWKTRLGEGYILACPTYPAGAWFTRRAEDLVLATVRAVQQRYRIDPNRIFLSGMSNGGIGAWLIGMHHAPLFAGLAPMASGIDDVLFPFLENLRATPVYIIHGSQDQVMPVELSRKLAGELKNLGSPFVYREHDRTHVMAGGHFFPREELPDLVKWFDAQHRDPAPKALTVVRDASHLLPFGWVRIDGTDQIASFSEDLIDKRDASIRQRSYARLIAVVTGPNRIEVRTDRVRQYTLFLNEDLVDLSKPIVVTTNGQGSFEGTLNPQTETLLRQARLRQDFGQLFPVHLTLSVPQQPS